MANGAFDAVVARHYSEGGEGAAKLADALVRACSTISTFHHLYDLNGSIENKILRIAQEMYGAGEVEFHKNVQAKIELYNAQVHIPCSLTPILSKCKPFHMIFFCCFFSIGIRSFANLYGKNIKFIDS